MKKRLFSIILTIIMVLSLMPASVLADEEAGGLLTLLLPEGLSAEGMEMVDESTYKVTRTIENGSILPITISSQDQGAFSAELAEQINNNSSISSNNLNATYNSDDTLTLSGSPAASVELDMNAILTSAMEGMDAYDAQPAATGCVQVGSSMYASLKEAVSAASAGDTLWLTADDAAEQQVTINKSLTIELQGHELSSTAIKVTGENVSVAINDRVGTGSINTNHAAGFSTSHNRCTATIVVADYATLTINGVTGTDKDTGTIIYECENKTTSPDLEKVLFVQNAGKLVINGGTFVAQTRLGCDALFVYDGTVTINDGYFFMNLSYNTAPSNDNPLTIKKCVIYNPNASGAVWIENSGTINGEKFGKGYQDLNAIKKVFLSSSEGSTVLTGSSNNHVIIGCGIYASDAVSSTTLSDGTLYCVGQTSETSPEQITPDAGDKITLAPQIAGGDGTTITYNWEKDGNTLSDANGATYTIDSYKGSDDGTYKVTATEGNNSVSLYYQIGDINEHKHCVCGKTNCSGDEHNATTKWKKWESATSLPTEAGNYYLAENVTLSDKWTVSNAVNLCLNGKIITGTNGYNDVICVNSSGSLTITDCQENVGKITHKSDVKQSHGINNQGILTFWNGSITGNTVTDNGGGVYNNGTFKMCGGEISGNTANGSYGGGVYNQNGATFTMTGGTISGNTAASYHGGGVYNNGTFNMTGGTISGNTANSLGGGVYNQLNATFTMTSGSITENTANGNGGGVYNYSKSCTLSGDVKITGNVKGGTITNGTLSGGTDNNFFVHTTTSKLEKIPYSLNVGTTGMESSASVGISGMANMTVIKGTTETTGFFCDDSTSYELQAVSGGLKLGYPEHKHCVCGSKSCSETQNGHTGKSTAEWIPVTLLTDITADGNYYLVSNININITWTCKYNINLCLNGKTLTGATTSSETNYDVIEVQDGKTLTITDCHNGDAVGKITHKEKAGGRGIHNHGTLNLWNGIITGNGYNVKGNWQEGCYCYGGGGVYNKGTFNMYGGKITGNTAVKNTESGIWINGAGVYNAGTFTLYGGTISGNVGGYGGGVYNYNAGYSCEFIMKGGSITGNNVTGSGGGVYNSSAGKFTMSGGSITDNNAGSGDTSNYYSGGGVYNESTFKLSGKVNISGNKLGGTFADDGTLSGGTENNVYIDKYNWVYWVIQSTGLTEGSSVGISGEENGTVVNGTTSTTGFFSDSADYELVSNENDGLKLEKVHRHCVCGNTNCTDTENHGESIIWQPWNTTTSLPFEGNYYLTADVTLTGTWNVSNTVSLCLNGKKIIGASGSDVIKVASSGKLTITDCTTESTKVGKITHNEGAKGRGIDNSGTLALWNGKISDSQTDANGAGVRNDGTFTMHGGVISGNSTGSGMWSGGGVYNNYNAKFTMTGGSITGNTGFYSGGVGNSGIFDISGGSITGNKTTQASNCGGGVWNYGKFNLSGNVNITGNTMSNGKANNVFPYSTASINVNGNLDESARVGVYKEAAGTIVVTGSTNTTIFTSDSDNYELVADNDNLKWVAVHKHCVCGKATAEGDTHTHDTTTKWTPWTSTDSLPTQAGSYYLMQSVTLSETWTVSGDVNLCLNGKLIIGADGNNTITVDSDSTLNITDCQTTGSITHATDTTGRGIENKGTLNLWNGSISGNDLSARDSDGIGSGGGIYNRGTLNMYGGSITDNYACDHGGGVDNYADGYTFTMTGGTIARNKSYEGGGVYTGPNAIFKMSGGVIGGDSADDGNIADSNGNNYDGNGGGVSNDGGIFIMSGNAKISYNTAGGSGGGVYYDCYNGASINSVLELSENAEISHNAAGSNGTGGGVYSYGKVTMTGGSIAYNTAKTAGGICSSGNYTFTMSGGNITGNTATYYGGVLNNSGNFNMTGGSITKNAANEGGGVRNYGTFTVTGGSITANNASDRGGGIQNSGTLKMSGAVTVSGNTRGSAANNVYLAYGKTIAVDTAGMDNTAKVGINVQDSESLPTVVTGSTNTNVFSSDSADYKLVDNKEGGLKLENQEVTISGVILKNSENDDNMTDNTKVYDGKAVAYDDSKVSYTPNVSGELSYTWQVKEEGSETYTKITDNIAPSDAGSYRLLVEFKRGNTVLGTANYDFTISKAALTIKNLAVADKDYDGNNTATISGEPTLSGLVGEESVTLKNGMPTFSSVNAGMYIDISFTNFSIEGDAAKNYTLTQPTGIKANINKKALTITGANVTAKTYDGTADAEVKEVFFNGLLNGETLSSNVDYTINNAKYDNINATGEGAATKVDFDVALSDTTLANNYKLKTEKGTQDSQTIKKADTADKTTNTSGTRGQENTFDMPDGFMVEGANIASITITQDANSIIARTPEYADNKLTYILSSTAENGQTATTRLKITSQNYNDYFIDVTIGVDEKKEIAITIDDATLTYDATPQAPTGITVENDLVPTSELVITYVGTGSTIYPQSSTAPTDAGTYSMSVSVSDTNNKYKGTATKAFTIALKEISATLKAENKTYDGGTSAQASATLTGVLASDADKVTATVTNPVFENKNADENKKVTASISLEGDAAGNYTVNDTAETKADIFVKEVSITGVTVENSKTYDKTTTAAITNNGTISDKVSTDSLEIKAGKATYDDEKVGTNKTVIFAGFALTGDDVKNYSLTGQPASVKADITAREVTISGVTIETTKVYDGNANAKITDRGKLDDVLTGDTVTIKTGKATYKDKNFGTAKTVTFSGFDITGTDAGNYVLSGQPENTTADITAKTVEVTVTAESKTYDGNANADVVVELSGIVGDDNVSLNTNGMGAEFDSADKGDNRTVTVSGLTLDNNEAGNYVLPSVITGTASITAKALTIAPLVIAAKFYDGTNKASFMATPKLVGVVSDEKVTLINGVPTFTSFSVGRDIPISFTEFTLSGDDKDNYTLIQPTGIKADIGAYIAFGSEYTTTTQDWTNKNFVVTAAKGWQVSETNTADGTWSDSLTRSAETGNTSGSLTFYVKNTTTGIISEAITKNYKIDKTAPTGEVRIDERNAWQEFVKIISFGIFYKDEQTVKVTAKDSGSGSGIAKTEYLITADDLSIEQLADKEFTTYTDAVGIEPDAKLIAYAKLTDVAGNVTYLRSDGIVLDGTVPVINGADNNKTYCAAVTLTITDEYLDTVKVNGQTATLTEDGKLTINPAEGAQIITATDKAGNSTSITVTVNDGCTWGSWISNGDDTHTRTCQFDASHTESGNCHGGTATCKDKAVCVDCKQSYGSIDETNHANLVHVEAKAPTTSAEGNKEYWYCDGCGKYFSNEDCTSETEKPDTVIKKLPVIINGNNAEVTDGEKQSLTFTSDAEFNDFIRVDVDGQALDSSCYTVESGSTIVTLSSDYVAALPVGEHTLDIVSENGTARAIFMVNAKAVEPTPTPDSTVKDAKVVDNKNSANSADTGDNSNVTLYLMLLLASGGAVAMTTLAGRRKKHKR